MLSAPPHAGEGGASGSAVPRKPSRRDGQQDKPDCGDRSNLLNSAPVSHADLLLWDRLDAVRDMARLRELGESAAYASGDPDTVVAYSRVHVRPALRRSEHLALIAERLWRSFTPDGILLARAIEERLYSET